MSPTGRLASPRSHASCLNILMADAEPRLRLDLMQRCALISRKKNLLLTMRRQFASFHDTGAMQLSRGAADPRTFWRGVFANGRMGLLQHVCEGCGSANSAESMVRVRAGDAGGDWGSNLSQKLRHNAPLVGNNLLSSPMHQRELERRHVLLFLLPQPALAQRFCNVRLFLLFLPPCCESVWGPPDS